MGAVAAAFYAEFQDYVVDGVPTSGVLQPSKAGARALGSLLESYISTQISDAAFANGFYHELCPITAENGAVSAGANAWKFRNCKPWFLTEVRASLETAGSTPTVIDVNVNGVSIMTNPVQVDASSLTSVGSVAPMAIATPNILDDQEIEIDVDSAGTGAQGLKVTLIGSTTTFGQAGTPYFVTGTFNAIGGVPVNATCSLPMPSSGILAGDIALLAVGTNVGDPPATISGWTAMGSQINQGFGSGPPFAFTHRMYWRLCDGTENGGVVGVYLASDPSVGGGEVIFNLSIWRSCAQTGAPFEGLGLNSNTGPNMTGQPIVTTGINRRAVTVFICDHSDTPLGGPATGWTRTNGGFLAEVEVLDAMPVPLPATVPAEVVTTNTHSGYGWAAWSFALHG